MEKLVNILRVLDGIEAICKYFDTNKKGK